MPADDYDPELCDACNDLCCDLCESDACRCNCQGKDRKVPLAERDATDVNGDPPQ